MQTKQNTRAALSIADRGWVMRGGHAVPVTSAAELAGSAEVVRLFRGRGEPSLWRAPDIVSQDSYW